MMQGKGKWALTFGIFAALYVFVTIEYTPNPDIQDLVSSATTEQTEEELQGPDEKELASIQPVTDWQAFPRNCSQKLLFVSDNDQGAAQGEEIRRRFNQDPRFSAIPICIYKETWVAPRSINCDENWQLSGRLGCQLLPLANPLKQIPFTHLVIFAEKGKANVHNGIMFLDRFDTYDVFIHELAHFSGFVDEYPLSATLAKRICAGVDAPNMAFKKDGSQEVDRQFLGAIGIRPQAKLYSARTCDNHSTQAFKASKRLTFMEYHDTAYIPEQYLLAWQHVLEQAPTHPSAHLNFAQMFEDRDNLQESRFWRSKYSQYLRQELLKVQSL